MMLWTSITKIHTISLVKQYNKQNQKQKKIKNQG